LWHSHASSAVVRVTQDGAPAGTRALVREVVREAYAPTGGGQDESGREEVEGKVVGKVVPLNVACHVGDSHSTAMEGPGRLLKI
jgi:hypothetical protein